MPKSCMFRTLPRHLMFGALVLALTSARASAQVADSGRFRPIAPPGGTCTYREPDTIGLRMGVRGVIQFELTGGRPGMLLMVDSLLRPVSMSDMRGGYTLFLFTPIADARQSRTFSAEERARAKALALDIVKRCPKVPVVRNASIPPAPHTEVLMALKGTKEKCIGPVIDSVSDRPRRRTVYELMLTEPLRTVQAAVDAAAPERLLMFTASVTWGAMTKQERESARLRFAPDGRVLEATKTLGYGSRTQHDTTVALGAAEIAQARKLAQQVVERCRSH